MFKGKPGTRIEAQEFPTLYPQENFDASCQDHAWMDNEQVSHATFLLGLFLFGWLLVLKPYLEEAPPGVQPLIFIDLHSCCHMVASVVNVIYILGVQSETIIPGGCCSGLCQPVDMEIGSK